MPWGMMEFGHGTSNLYKGWYVYLFIPKGAGEKRHWIGRLANTHESRRRLYTGPYSAWAMHGFLENFDEAMKWAIDRTDPDDRYKRFYSVYYNDQPYLPPLRVVMDQAAEIKPYVKPERKRADD